MKKKAITFNETCEVSGKFGKGVISKQYLEKGKAVRVRMLDLPKDEANMLRASEVADYFQDVKKKMDIDCLEVLLNSRAARHMTQAQVEVLLGKALVGGDLVQAKRIFNLGKKKFPKIAVTNNYFFEFAHRKKRSVPKDNETFQYLIYMTLARQGDPDIIQFMVDHLPEGESHDFLNNVHSTDGDMLHAEWQAHLLGEMEEDLMIGALGEESADVALAKAAHKLDQPPKEKILIAHYESDNLLTSCIKNNSPGLQILLDKLVSPATNSLSSFKMAARLGLIDELTKLRKAWLKEVKRQKTSNKAVIAMWDKIIVAVVSSAALENQIEVLVLLREWMASKKKNLRASVTEKKDHGDHARGAKFPELDYSIRVSVGKMMKNGIQPLCTYRHRIIYGVCVSLLWENQSEANELDPLMSQNEFIRRENGILRVNNEINYRDQLSHILNPQSVEFLNINGASGGAMPSSPSLSSSRGSLISTASDRSEILKKKSDSVIPRRTLYQFFTAVLQQQDYNGGLICSVLLKLGLEQFFDKKSKEQDSNASIISGMSSIGDDNRSVMSSANSVMSKGSRTSNLSSSSLASAWDKGREAVNKGKEAMGRIRRSTSVGDMVDFFGKVGHKVEAVVKGKLSNRATTSEKISAIELAANYGDFDLLDALLEVIAKKLDLTVLKCLYLSAGKNKPGSVQTLYTRILNLYADIQDSPNAKDVKAYTIAFKTFHDFSEGFERSKRNVAKQQRMGKAKPGTMKQPLRKKSIVDAISTGFKSMKNSRKSFSERMASMSVKDKLSKARKSITGAFGGNNQTLFKKKKLSENTGMLSIGANLARQTFAKNNKNNKMSKKFRNALKSTSKNVKATEDFDMPSNANDYEDHLFKLMDKYLNKILEIAIKVDKPDVVHALLADRKTHDEEDEFLTDDKIRDAIVLALKNLCNVKLKRTLNDARMQAVGAFARMLVNEVPKSKKEMPKFLHSVLRDCMLNLAHPKTRKDHVTALGIIATETESSLRYQDIVDLLAEVGINYDDAAKRAENENDPTFGGKFWPIAPKVLELVISILGSSDKKKVGGLPGELAQGMKLPKRIMNDVKHAC